MASDSMRGPWVTDNPEGDANEILYVVTVSDLIGRYNERHDPGEGGDGATWEGLDDDVKGQLIDRCAEALRQSFNSLDGYYWGDALDDAIAAVEGKS